MGALSPTPGSAVYLDANSIIYSVERIEPYASQLVPVWDGARAGAHILLASSTETPSAQSGMSHIAYQ